MAQLEISYAITFENQDLPPLDRHGGPLFHRWLPDGEADALQLETGHPAASLTAYFVRRGYMERKFIRFDYDRREVDPSTMARQAILDAGPMTGWLALSDITNDQLDVLAENRIGDPAYIELGKRIVNLLQPPLQRLIEILRTNFGQYWLRQLRSWDSRSESLGAYCSHLQLGWRIPPETAWRDFIPTDPQVSLTVRMPAESEFSQYLLEDDFRALPAILASNYCPGLPATTLSRAHENFDQGAIGYAFIEATTALELAIHDYIRRHHQGSHQLTKAVEAFWGLPKRSQLASLVPLIHLPVPDIEAALDAIEIRHKIVHEGFQPFSDPTTRAKLRALTRVVGSLLPGPAFKYPSSAHGNMLYAENDDSTRPSPDLGHAAA